MRAYWETFHAIYIYCCDLEKPFYKNETPDNVEGRIIRPYVSTVSQRITRQCVVEDLFN